LEVLNAKLVQHEGSYSIIGELQNVDNTPADVTIKGTLYNGANVSLANYNAKYHIRHKLMPKEITSFRIDFEGIAWSSTKDTLPPTFNPDEFTPVDFKQQPTKFNLQCAGNVAITDLYKQLALQKLHTEKEKISGTLFNSGVQEVTIPQLLISYYDEKKELIWVDNLFPREGVRIQRKQNFEYETQNLNGLRVITSSLANCFVNGMPNASIAKKTFPNRNTEHSLEQLQPLQGDGFEFIKIELNGYIGNPK